MMESHWGDSEALSGFFRALGSFSMTVGGWAGVWGECTRPRWGYRLLASLPWDGVQGLLGAGSGSEGQGRAGWSSSSCCREETDRDPYPMGSTSMSPPCTPGHFRRSGDLILHPSPTPEPTPVISFSSIQEPRPSDALGTAGHSINASALADAKSCNGSPALFRRLTLGGDALAKSLGNSGISM